MTLFLPAPQRTPRRRVIHDTIENFCRDYRGERFHALLCDPPYHLTSITKRFGADSAAPAKFGKDGAFSRASAGFMGKQWDGGDVAFRPETWAMLAELLLPGAFIMAFAGTRGYHRMACAIEDAGLIIHPAIGWSFGSGFPKATRIDTQVDKSAGVERLQLGYRSSALRRLTSPNPMDRARSEVTKLEPVTEPATVLAQTWEGHRYGLQSLKPAFEFIAVAQKPYEGRPVDSIVASGAGALNIDGGRIGTDSITTHGGHRASTENYRLTEQLDLDHDGRWPANFALVHSTDCTPSVCVPSCAVRRLSEQTGLRGAGGDIINAMSEPATNVYSGRYGRHQWQGYEDEGTAARFFHCADWSNEVAEQLAMADPVHYCAKASTEERSRGLEWLDSSERVGYNQTTVNSGGTQWEKPDQNPNIQAESDIRPKKDTTDLSSGIPKLNHPEVSSNTTGFGNKQMDLFQSDTKSTISTETNKTTDSKTSNLLITPPTNACIVGANSGTDSGGNSVNCAESSNPSPPNTGTSQSEDTRSMDGASRVTSEKWSTINVSAKRDERPVEEAVNRVSGRNTHPT